MKHLSLELAGGFVAKGGKVGGRHVTFSRIQNRFSPTPLRTAARATHSRRLFNCHRLSPTARH